ncbi:MAG: hypothetical protein KA004_06005 [Verrucomicrobiales bacterium]|nr:hypothetical protein [Verrucomicrobiales bacterium]
MNAAVRWLASISGLMLLVGGLSSCSGVRFDREWQAAKTVRHTGPAAAVAGAWEGRWVSQSSGHSGKLRCLVSPDAAGRTAIFRYEATWGDLFSGQFTLKCDLTPAGSGVWNVAGSKDLGKLLGGKFSHNGTVAEKEIKAQYHSKADQGNFTLHRPKF